MTNSRGERPIITVDLTNYPQVFTAIKEAAAAMDWTASTLLRRNLVAAFNAGADFKNALTNLGAVANKEER